MIAGTLVADLVGSSEKELSRKVAVQTQWEYRAERPYEIRVSFRTGGTGWADWEIARELIAFGTVEQVGDGDVIVWPSGELLMLALATPDSSALFEFMRGEVEEFLERTYELIPLGAERMEIDWDSGIARILEES